MSRKFETEMPKTAHGVKALAVDLEGSKVVVRIERKVFTGHQALLEEAQLSSVQARALYEALGATLGITPPLLAEVA